MDQFYEFTLQKLIFDSFSFKLIQNAGQSFLEKWMQAFLSTLGEKESWLLI